MVHYDLRKIEHLQSDEGEEFCNKTKLHRTRLFFLAKSYNFVTGI